MESKGQIQSQEINVEMEFQDGGHDGYLVFRNGINFEISLA